MPTGLIICALVLACATSAIATSSGLRGQLDHSFNGSGQQFGSWTTPVDAAVQRDGKIVTLEQWHFASESGIEDCGSCGDISVVRRYLSNGTIDKAFGEDGASVQDMNETYDLALDQSGRVLVAGRITDGTYETDGSTSPAVARLQTDGAKDKSFGYHGIREMPLAKSKLEDPPLSTEAYAVTTDQRNRLLVAVELSRILDYRDGYRLWRLLPSGRVDRSFGQRGRVSYQAPARRDYVRSTEISTVLSDAASGHISVAGNLDGEPFVTRYRSDGSRSSDFSRSGSRVLRSGRTGWTTQETAAAAGPAGSIYLASGVARRRSGKWLTGVGVTRVLKSGRVDRSFGTRGVTLVDTRVERDRKYVNARPHSLAVRDGEIIVAGRKSVFKLTADGRRDKAFATDGKFESKTSCRLGKAEPWQFVAKGLRSTGIVAQGAGRSIVLANCRLKQPGDEQYNDFEESFTVMVLN